MDTEEVATAVLRCAPSLQTGASRTVPTLGLPSALLSASLSNSGGSCRNPPHAVSRVIGDQQRSLAVHRQGDRPPARLVAIDEETCDDVLRWPRRASINERYVDDLVAIQYGAVPASVLTHKGASPIMLGQIAP